MTRTRSSLNQTVFHQNSAKRFQIHVIFNLLAGKDTPKARGDTPDLLVKNFVPTVKKTTWAEEADKGGDDANCEVSSMLLLPALNLMPVF